MLIHIILVIWMICGLFGIYKSIVLTDEIAIMRNILLALSNILIVICTGIAVILIKLEDLR